MGQLPASFVNRTIALAKRLPWRLPERHWLILFASVLLSVCVPWILLTQPGPSVPVRSPPQITKLRLSETSQAVVLRERPLFNSNRSAEVSEIDFASGVGISSVSNLPAPPAPAAPTPPELVGVATGKNRAIAIVKGNDGLARNLAPGQIVDGWTLTEVGRASASFRNGDFKQTVALGLGNKQPPSAGKLPAGNLPEQIEAPDEENY
jgi:hypothetical protein